MGCRKCKVKTRVKKGVTVGGPTPGITFYIKPDKKHYFFTTPTNPYYCGAYYTLINGVTPLGEQIAIFVYRLKREKNVKGKD